MKSLNDFLPDSTDRLSFLKGLVIVGLSDGTMSEEELAYFRTAAVSLGARPEDADKVISEVCQQADPTLSFSSPAAARFFVREVVQLASLDGDLSAVEERRIRRLADKIQVAPELVDRVFAWVHAGLRWRAEGDALVNEEAAV